ncbi:MAG: helix-turn-helix domain-containing protein [Myxococcota bacterium]
MDDKEKDLIDARLRARGHPGSEWFDEPKDPEELAEWMRQRQLRAAVDHVGSAVLEKLVDHAGELPAGEPGVGAPIDPDRLYTPKDLESVLQCGRTSVYEAFAKGLRYCDLPGGRRVRGADLQDWLRGRRTRSR